MHQRVSFIKLIMNDQLSFILAIVGPVFIAIAIFMTIYGFIPTVGLKAGQAVDQNYIHFFTVFAFIVAFISIYALLRSFNKINLLFESGVRVVAKVVNIHFYGDKGSISVEYTVGKTVLKHTAPIMKTKTTQSLVSKESVTLILDGQRPEIAYITELFI